MRWMNISKAANATICLADGSELGAAGSSLSFEDLTGVLLPKILELKARCIHSQMHVL